MSTATYVRQTSGITKPRQSSCSLRRLTNARAAWLIGDREAPSLRSWLSRFARRLRQ